jgi:ParB/RepB/Spo0J family partition protein
MKLSDEFVRLPLASIIVDRDARQRRELFDKDGNFIDKDGLLASVATHGVLSPILIDRNYKLIFGERRYTASVLSERSDIPIRFVEDLSASEYEQLELIENLCRQELEWKDEVRAIAKLHAINLTSAKAEGRSWSIEATAEQIGRSFTIVSRMLRVWKDFESPRIAQAVSMQQAFNTLSRLDERAEADALADLVDATSELFDGAPKASGTDGAHGESLPENPAGGALNGDGTDTNVPEGDGTPRATGSIPPLPTAMAREPDAILHTSFLEWAPTYTGRPFNLLHCDFPYGVNVFGGAWSGRNSWQTYEDTPDDYITLIRCLCENLDRIVAPSAHVLFWCSANIRIQASTVEMFRELAPSLIFNEFPLYWHKTDNIGIVPDPSREARRVVETCLYATRADRKIVKTVSGAYGSPTNKDLHPSTKPEPMLRHFLQMFVDENTTLLDPTAGSGSALRAAESLGAKSVLGLEKDQEYARNSNIAIRNFRNLRKVSK